MYPLKFKNLYFEKIWGGRELSKFRDNLPDGNIGESWDIACHPNGIGKVINGSLKGTSFDELLKNYREEVFGRNFKEEQFPLLIKLINSNDDLSVQVHPGDEYARKNENSLGKTEFWYVIEASDDASLIVGTKNCSASEFKKAIENCSTEKYLNKIKVKKGDFFFVPSGLVHAICKGVIVAEIQQNSDITYRVYDYGRPRKIHVKKALDVIDFSLNPINIEKSIYKDSNISISNICDCQYFKIEKLDIKNKFKVNKGDEYYTYTCVDGEGYILGDNFKEKINTGDSVLIPSKLKLYTIEGNLKLLKTIVK